MFYIVLMMTNIIVRIPLIIIIWIIITFKLIFLNII